MKNASANFDVPPPPFPAPPRSVDLSPLKFVLALVAVFTVPALAYTFFFSVKCPLNPFRLRHRSSSGRHSIETDGNISNREVVPVPDVKLEKETRVEDVGAGGMCIVCLSVLGDNGKEVKQLSACKHSFHATCIDRWLNNKPNCPVCRAPFAGKRPDGTGGSAGDEDSQQGLPRDASELV
ncbi:RING-H2 finger protein ATL33-like [Juglans microcarpa x Juglans regia]|uniref:RING-H2 finger protein ATL33-like n=1 Tax=Juglans microcarpa x Juglans regia TaxID=2249226 RepID=UPI001B7F388E|nr:RING-H2 finger protein ATL33-like [Juglans microcarpa x Juglans regia]